nr:RHS repeat-associated core domain-containing protein [Gemmatimonadota bacterium]
PGRNLLALSYDAAGRLLSVASATIDTRMTYQPGTGLLSSVSAGAGATGQAYALQYDGRLPISITASGLVNGRVDYTYTTDLWLKSVAIAGRTPITYDYDADGLVTRGGALTVKRDPLTGAITGDTIGVVATSRTYDDHGALSGIELRIAGTPTWSQRLTRDSIDRITVQRDSDATAGVVVTGYHYDAQDRLDLVTRDGVAAQAFTFDAAGNRTAVTTSAGVVAATYSADDRILSYDGQTITHDASGARATEVRGADTLGYQYDDLGRMTQLSSRTDGALSFRYDADGRRVQELRGGAVVRSLLYGGSTAPMAELTAAGTVKSEFVQITGELAPDYLVQGATTYYLVHDQLGSVRQVIDVNSGSVAQAVDYDVIGVVTRNTATGFQPFGYVGGLNDADGRTVHFGARDYDARTGRWIQPDPIGIEGGQTRYEYGANDPINSVDPVGLCPLVCPEDVEQLIAQVRSGRPIITVVAGVGMIGGGGVFVAATSGVAVITALDRTFGPTQGDGPLTSGFAPDALNTEGRRKGGKRKPTSPEPSPAPEPGDGHRKGARESTRKKHEDGDARRRRDKGCEKADVRRDGNPNKR